METALDQLASLYLICYQKDTGFIGVPSCTQENFLKRIGPGGAMVGLERTKKLLFGILHNQIHVHFDQFTVQDQVVVSAWSPHVSKLVDLLNALRPVYPQLPGSLELCHLLVLNAKCVSPSNHNHSLILVPIFKC